MDSQSLIILLKAKPDLTQLAAEAGNDPSLRKTLFALIRTEQNTVRYRCTKVLRILSEQQPEIVYPYFNDIVSWLHAANSFVKWDGILTLSHLIAVDTDDRFVPVYEEYFGLIRDPQMITAANVAGNAWRFIQARPEWEPDITQRLLEVPNIVYLHHGEPSPECNHVLCGHVLVCFDHYFDQSQKQADILHFAQTQLNCPRKAVAKSAAHFLQRHAKEEQTRWFP